MTRGEVQGQQRPGRTRVLPGPHAAGLVLLVAAMLYAGLSQSNNAAFVLAFLILSIACLSAVHAWRNLRELAAAVFHPEEAFAGAAAELQVKLENLGRREAAGVTLHCAKDEAGPVNIAPESHEVGFLDWHPGARGWQRPPAIELRSSFPLGFFSTRRVLPAGERMLVYPAPSGVPELPRSAGEEQEQQLRQHEGDDFAGVRAYQPGESQRHIDWKAAARGAPLLVKQFADVEPDAGVVLDFSVLDTRDEEARLSQLALWVLQAERQGVAYELILPGCRVARSRGDSHRQECLRLLSLHGEREEEER